MTAIFTDNNSYDDEIILQTNRTKPKSDSNVFMN